MNLGEQTVTVVRAGVITGRDDLGLPVRGPDIRTSYEGCSFQPLLGRFASSEQTPVDTDLVTTRWRAFLPPEADVTAVDRLEVPGYPDTQVDGRPALWPDETGTPDHVEFLAKLWTG